MVSSERIDADRLICADDKQTITSCLTNQEVFVSSSTYVVGCRKHLGASSLEIVANRMAERKTTAGRSRPRANLAEGIATILRERVASGDLQPGDKLPTENELARTHGVSRTVVREAIAALRADGLVTARQGSGAYVSDAGSVLQRPSLLNFDPKKLSSIIEVLELRAAVETEAAALAAERSSPAELAKIKECHEAMARAVTSGEQAESQDFVLHLAIAESTHNRHFVEFFRFLGSRTIPRAQAAVRGDTPGEAESYLKGILGEHSDIVDAISARNSEAARSAMRAHLKRSQDRYERLARLTS